MTRDEARALIARAANHEAGRQRGLTDRDDWEEITEQERGGWLLLADAVLDALFAGGEVERRYANWWKDRPQTRRVVLVSDEWEDENDG